MPNFKFDKFLAVKVKSQSKPLSGQTNRSSDNYDFRELKKASKLKWTCPNGVSFNVMEDKKAATDPVTFTNVTNGTITMFPNDNQANGLYIANPKNATAEFEIEVMIYEDALPQNWMMSISDSKSISELSIPGTHDSGASRGISQVGRCQTLSIFDQLYTKGVRFLDIRCKVDGNSLKIYHGIIPQDKDLDDVLNACKHFLMISPKEAIIMSVKNEADSDNEKFEEIFKKYYEKQTSLWFIEDKIPNLKDVRGKVILFRRFATSKPNPIGIDASPKLWKDKETFEITRKKGDKNIKIQDVYSVSDGDVKFNTYIKAMMEESTDKSKWYINFASATISWSPPNAASISNVVNPKLNEYLNNHTFSGVILMDYIDQDSSGDHLDVAKKIIKNNFIN